MQWQRAREEVAAAHRRGVDEDDLRLLTADEATAVVGATDVVGHLHSPLRRPSGPVGARSG